MKAFEPEQFLFMGGIHALRKLGVGIEDSNLTEKEKQECLHDAEAAETLCRKLGLTLSEMAIERIKDFLSLNAQISLSNVVRLFDELENRIIDEMKSRAFFSIEPSKQKLFTEDNLFGNEVAAKFPSAEVDISNAGKCLALDQWTASVFHSIRVLEIGLDVLAKELGVSSDRRNWGNIISEIEAKIKDFSKNPSGNEWKPKEQFYSEAALQFRYFKNAWRNHVMHVRDTYDEQRADTIFEHVKEFMAHLATRLNEDIV